MEKNNKTNILFSGLINNRINEGVVGANKRIINYLLSKNIHLSMRTIQRYRRGERVPDFYIAKEILEILNITVDDNELYQILEESRNYVPDNLTEKQYNSYERTSSNKEKLKKRISINLDELELETDEEQVSKNEIINNRLLMLYGDRTALDTYVRELIEYDLKNEILKGEEE